jgi:hypothetical protein
VSGDGAITWAAGATVHRVGIDGAWQWRHDVLDRVTSLAPGPAGGVVVTAGSFECTLGARGQLLDLRRLRLAARGTVARTAEAAYTTGSMVSHGGGSFRFVTRGGNGGRPGLEAWSAGQLIWTAFLPQEATSTPTVDSDGIWVAAEDVVMRLSPEGRVLASLQLGRSHLGAIRALVPTTHRIFVLTDRFVAWTLKGVA